MGDYVCPDTCTEMVPLAGTPHYIACGKPRLCPDHTETATYCPPATTESTEAGEPDA